MELINTPFNIGDEVYFLHRDEICKDIIKKIIVVGSIEKVNDTIIYCFDLEYRTCNMTDLREEQMFISLEEIEKHLMRNLKK